MDLDLGHPRNNTQHMSNTTPLTPSGIASTTYPDRPAPSAEVWRRWIMTGEDWTDEVPDPIQRRKDRVEAQIKTYLNQEKEMEKRRTAVLDRFKASLLPQRPAR